MMRAKKAKRAIGGQKNDQRGGGATPVYMSGDADQTGMGREKRKRDCEERGCINAGWRWMRRVGVGGLSQDDE